MCSPADQSVWTSPVGTFSPHVELGWWAHGPLRTLPLRFYAVVVFDFWLSGLLLLLHQITCTCGYNLLLSRLVFLVVLLCFPSTMCTAWWKEGDGGSPACHASSVFCKAKYVPICAIQIFGLIMNINIAKHLELGKVLSGRAFCLSWVALGQWTVTGRSNILMFHNQNSSVLLFQENN